jgi:hypothetical protein
MRQKAIEKGIKACPSCGTEDIFFALNGMCLECNKPIQRNSKEKTLQFSIEVFVEFFEKYDEVFSAEQKKNPIQFLKGLINTLIIKGALENEKIITLQSIVKNIGQIGGNNFGGAIVVESGKPSLQLLKDFSVQAADPMSRIKSLSAVILSIQYILDYKVKNEFVIETAKASSTTRNFATEQKPNSANKGCLGSIILILIFISFVWWIY